MSTSWQCEVGLPGYGLTVGTPFTLTCGGAEVPTLDTKSLSLELAKSDRFVLRILETKSSSPSKVELGVTGYTVGEFKVANAVLTDGTNRIDLSPIEFKVETVIEKQDPPVQPTPVPPFAPVTMLWPVWVWVVTAGVLIALTGAFFWARSRRLAKQNFAKWLKDNRTPLSAYDQLNKDLRKAQRERNPLAQLEEIEKALRWYLARRLEHPVLESSPAKIAKYFKRYERSGREVVQPLALQLFKEFGRLRKVLATQATENEVDQALNKTLPAMQDMAREFSEAVEKIMSAKDRRKRVAQ